MDYAQRRAQLGRFDDLDAVVLVPGANLLYFTGLHYHASERPIVMLVQPQGGALSLIVPELEVPVLRSHPELDVQVFQWTDADGYQGAFDRAIDELGLCGGRLGVDENTMRLFEWLAFETADPTLRLKSIGADLLNIRAIKSAEEIEAMRTAAQMSEAAFGHVLAQVRPGMTERQIAERIDEALRESGCSSLAFPALVQTGENSAVPHGAVSDRVLNEGEFLLIDFGGRHGDYPADITRTFCIGEPTDEMQRIYDTVRAANRAAIAAVRPGVTCGVVDQAAREVIEAAGYGEYFIHRTGHGLGLEVHELPQIAPGVDDVLKAGMVFTVEPGIYVPGLGGVRLEENLAVTETGADVLTRYPMELRLLS